jgi:DNA-binding transcriptional LysR family regulator
MSREIDLSLLRAFVAVAETNNMTVAGRRLNLTQAAVSQQIKRLEDQFGSELFDRQQRRLRLTPSGEKLVSYAEHILAQNDEIWGLMTRPEIAGQVRLGVPQDLVAAFMPLILRSFAKSWPRVEIQLTCRFTDGLRQLLKSGALDLVITTEPTPSEDAQLLLTDQLVWVGALNGVAHEMTPLPVSMGDEYCAFRAPVARALAAAGREWRFTCVVNNISALCATIEADLAVAPLLSQTVPEHLTILGSETSLPQLPSFYVNLYKAQTNPNPISAELAEHITRSFAVRYPKAA